MPLLLLLLFVATPLVELYVLIKVGAEIGALPTIALCLGTAFLGALLIRVQGISTLMRVRASLDRGEVPAVELLEGAVLLVSGLLLLTPGLVTDCIGFLALVPPLRRHLILVFLDRHVRPVEPGIHPRGGGAPRPRIIEGEYRREDD